MSQWSTGFNLVAVPRDPEGGGSLLNPSVYVTEVVSLASMVTDQDIEGDPVRTIPPHYRGVSVVRGSLDLDICITGAPFSQVVEGWDFTDGKWGGGWLRGVVWVYQDEFEFNTTTGLQEPALNVLHPWQDDLIPGGVHTEFNRPKRILFRRQFALPGSVDMYASANEFRQSHGIQNRGAYKTKVIANFRKAYVDERSAIWLAVMVSNPWIPGLTTPDPNQIGVGIVGIGRVIYKLRAT